MIMFFYLIFYYVFYEFMWFMHTDDLYGKWDGDWWFIFAPVWWGYNDGYVVNWFWYFYFAFFYYLQKQD